MRTDTDLSAVRWHAGALNNGLVVGLSHYLVTHLPVAGSYALGHAGTWIAYHLMRDGTRAIVDNLRVVRPDATERELKRLALLTYRSYARDATDFIQPRDGPNRALPMMAPAAAARSTISWPMRRSVVIVGGHSATGSFGVALRLLHGYPATVVASASQWSERSRRACARSPGQTLEIRIETALQIRRLLAGNVSSPYPRPCWAGES